MPGKRPYVADQRMQMLHKEEVEGDLREVLSPAHFRGLRLARDKHESGAHDSPRGRVWKPLPREKFWTGVRDGRYCRIVLVTDAGVGKTTTIKWLGYMLNRPDRRSVAMSLDVAELPPDPDDLPAHLAKRLRHAVEGVRRVSQADAERLLVRLRDQGRLILLFDALDQASDEKIAVLHALIGMSVWQPCAVVVSGRPYMIERHLQTQQNSWLFRDQHDWEYVQLKDFDERQQRRYLGDVRYRAIRAESRTILATPRVLYYIGEIPDSQLSEIETPSDVFYLATSRLLNDGIEGAAAAKGLTAQDARLLLAAMAFEMSVAQRNFDGMPTLDLLPGVVRRCRSHDNSCNRSWCQKALDRLAAINTFLSHGLLEPGCPQEVFWRDRSLQEYFAGLWLAAFCTTDDANELWNRVHRDIATATATTLRGLGPPIAESSEFYWVYRYAAEMPAGPGGRRPNNWIMGVEPLYRPGDGTCEGTRRWTEMMYRSWTTLEYYAHCCKEPNSGQAKQILDTFRAEFGQVLDGAHGHVARTVACTIVDGFCRIPPEVVEQDLLVFSLVPTPSHHSWTFNDGHVRIARPFELNSRPVSWKQYALFDPAHAVQRRSTFESRAGTIGSESTLGRRVETALDNTTPVLSVSWYDAWAFCRWLGSQYRLPTEAEWEFACRASRIVSRSIWNNWTVWNNWIHATERPNPWGLYDMHSSVWEWTVSAPWTAESVAFHKLHRIARGGSYHTGRPDTTAFTGRAEPPGSRSRDIGFRVAKDATPAF